MKCVLEFFVGALALLSVTAIRPSSVERPVKKFLEGGHLAFNEVETGKVGAYPSFDKGHYPRFPQPWVIDENRRCSGYLFGGCVFDTQVTVRFAYKEHVAKVDQVPMTPDVCFNFCKNISGAQFFSLEQGRECYCTPFFDNQAKGGEGHCNTPCEGDHASFCGGLRKASLFSMHDCLNTPPSTCQQPPALVHHAKAYPSLAYGNRSTPCRNLKTNKGDSGPENNHCEVECLEGYALKDNTLRCASRGNALESTSVQFVGSAACEPVSCGEAPVVPHATYSHGVVRYGPEGHVTYTCLAGYTLNGTSHGLTQFTVDCQANGTITTLSSCVPVHCGAPPVVPHASTAASSDQIVFSEVVTYELETGYETTDGSTQFIVTCGQDGDFTPVIGMISPMATCGAPLAFPSATVISEVTSVSYPGQVRYMCLEGHSLDGKWGNASDMEHTTNMMFASACTLDGAFSVETDPCVPVACGLPPAVEFATSSSAHMSLVYGESAQYHCDHGHTVDGNAASNVSFAVPCNSNGNFTLRPQDECKPVVCSRVPVVPNTLPLAASGLSGSVVFGDSSPVFTCSPGYSTRVDDFQRVDTTFSFICSAHGEFDVDRECVNVDDCLETDCGAGVCRDLPNPTGNNSTDHYACDCDPGYAEVVVGGTHRTCHNNCSFGYEVVEGEGCKDVNECVLWGGNAACFPGTCHNGVGAYSCTCPSGFVSVAEDGKPHCRIEVCGVAPIVNHASRNDTGKIPHGRAVRYTCDAGHTIQDGVPDAPTEWTVSCDAGGAFSAGHTCHPVKCTLPTVANTEHPHGEVLYGETVTYGCQSGFSVDGRAASARSLRAACGADGQARPVGECKPISCGEPIFVTNAIVDNREYFYLESAAYECQHGYTTTGLASGSTTFTSACTAGGVFASPAACRAVSCGIHVDEHGVAAPPDEMLFPSSLTVTCNPGHSTVTGDASGAASYSVSCGASGQRSYTSQSCAPSSSEFLHYCVSDGRQCSSSVCCAGYVGSDGRTFPCADAESSNNTCGTTQPVNLYNASTMRFSALAYDVMTQSTPTGVTRTGEMRFSNVLWYDGQPYDLLLQAVDDSGRAVTNSVIKNVWPKEELFSLEFAKKTTQNVKFSIVSPGTTSAITLPELFMTVLDIDCINKKGICETIESKDHHMYVAGDNVNVVKDGDKITATAKTHLNGEGNPVNTNLNGEQKSHSLTLSWRSKPYFVLTMKVGRVWGSRAMMLSGISTHKWTQQTAAMKLPTPALVIPESDCAEAPSCLPISCAPQARANSTPSSTSVAFGALGTWTCKPGYSVDGTPSGNTAFNLACLSSGSFDEEGHQDCIDIDYCSRDPCGANGVCYDCSTQDCNFAPTQTTFLQRGGISGGLEFEATEHYACWCHEHFLTAVGSEGQLTCHTGCSGHSCGEGGSCVDLSVTVGASSGQFTCSCHWGYTLIPHGGPDGGDTCSRIGCGPLSVENSDAHPSAEFFAGDSAMVHCDHGHAHDQTARGTAFEVACTETGAFSGVRSCSKILCQNAPVLGHAVTTGSSALYGETLTYSCLQGYTHGSGGATEFSVACRADGMFESTSGCEAVQCGTPVFPHVTVHSAGSMHFGQSDTGYCDRGYVTSHGLRSFVFSCASSGSFAGVQSCDIVTCPVPSMANVHPPAAHSLPYGQSLTVVCKDGFHVDELSSFPITCQEDGAVSGGRSCVRAVFAVSGTVTNQLKVPIHGATVTIGGVTVTTAADGYYAIPDVPHGTQTMKVAASGYLTSSSPLAISADTSRSPSLYKELAAGQWRWTLEWRSVPHDLDSHVHWGQDLNCSGTSTDKDIEPCSSAGSCHVYFPHRGSRHTCASTCTEQGYWDGNCQRASVVLSNDDADGNGPENVYLENVGHCDGSIKDCMLVYEVKNYEWQTSGIDGAGWVVKMFNEHGLAHEKHQPLGVAHTTVWYVVFTMNLKTGKVCDGWVDFSAGKTC